MPDSMLCNPVHHTNHHQTYSLAPSSNDFLCSFQLIVDTEAIQHHYVHELHVALSWCLSYYIVLCEISGDRLEYDIILMVCGMVVCTIDLHFSENVKNPVEFYYSSLFDECYKPD